MKRTNNAIAIATDLNVDTNTLFGNPAEERRVDRKPTINALRRENGLSEIPDGDVVLTKV